MHGIIAHESPVPTLVQQRLARDDLAGMPRQQHQHLHHPRFQRAAAVGRFDLQQRRHDPEGAKPETGHIGENDVLLLFKTNQHFCRRKLR